MQIINNNTVVVYNSDELKQVLEEDNTYMYIYFGDNITLNSSILINSNKTRVIIDGTYLNNKYTYTGFISTEKENVITVSSTNEKITFKNMNIINPHVYGVIYVPASNIYSSVITEYINITFNGIQMFYNPYGTARIIDCNITIETTNELEPQEVGEAYLIEIGGNTLITSNAQHSTLFYYPISTGNPRMTFLPYSTVNLTSDTKELIGGTNKLDFEILHDANVTLTTGNGFAAYTIHGANNVLIGPRASFNFIETKHQRIPMWSIFGDFSIEEGAKVSLINTYTSTPIDNYNIHFKGSNQKLNIYKPHSLSLYSKNANVLYSNNELEFNLVIDRINMWNNSVEVTIAGGIENLPDYAWYKEEDTIKITGTLNKDVTSIITHNFTIKELSELPDLSNFNLGGNKQLSIGNYNININPISSGDNTISGHTLPFADVLIKYDTITEIVNADDEGQFEYIAGNTIPDDTNITIISNVASSFIYKSRSVITPFTGELTLMDVPNNTTFSLIPISTYPVILPKVKEDTIKVIDSRINSSNWKLYVHLSQPLVSINNFKLLNALIFKTFNNDIIILNEVPSLVYTSNDNGGNTEVYNLTWSTDKGLLLRLIDNYLEINEEYNTIVFWSIEE